jgi:hypothetical protein
LTVSTPRDENDLHVRAVDDLASFALGEAPDPGIAEHIEHCERCQAELADYQRIAALARLSGRDDDADVPPAGLWERIEAELAPPVVQVAPRSPAPRWRRGLIAAAAAIVVIGAALGGWLIGRSSTTMSANRSAHAVLQAQPGTADEVHGTATMHTSTAGYTMDVKTNGLPAYNGYYEVWLYNPSVGTMVAVGTLGTGGKGSFTVPGGIDTQAYHVVDVSAQRYNGDNRHQRSVLRGALER